jgi:hypothetical protein
MKKKLIFAVIATMLLSCKSVKYIPVETTKIEYRDNFVKDSIFRYDSVFVVSTGMYLTDLQESNIVAIAAKISIFFIRF